MFCTTCSTLFHCPRLFFLILDDLNQNVSYWVPILILPMAGFIAPVPAPDHPMYLAFLQLSILLLVISVSLREGTVVSVFVPSRNLSSTKLNAR